MEMRKRRFWLAASVAILVLLLAGCNLDDLQPMSKFSEDFSQTHALKQGGAIEVSTRNGAVEVLGWEKDFVEITGSKYARTQEELDRVEVKIAASEDAISIKTVFPGPARGGSGARYVIRAPHHARVTLLNTSNGAIRVEDVARVEKLDTSNGSITVNRSKGPLVADTSNGAIRVAQTPGDLRLDTSNGRIEADDVEGTVIADTSNGSIRVTVTDPPPGGDLRFDTSNGAIEVTVKRFEQNPMLLDSSNGSITLRLPEGIDADLHASTSNGNIQTDFAVTTVGEIKKNELKGKLGAGGALVRVATSNSSLRILRD
ncbi:MAG: DUF4097 family beta strand repeat protein [Bryobacterales bacterium]|nr:DUF4097 family beta strand repeat protein [Bryobacterales bacterium]